MHSEAVKLAKEMVELDVPLTVERQISFLEEDLALSSSTHESIAEKTLTEFEEKTHDEDSTRQSPSHTPSQTPSQTSESSLSQPQQPSQQEPQQAPVIYVSEDAMDCNYDDASNLSRNLELQEAPSPELFDSENDEADDEAESTASTFPKLEEVRPSLPSPKKFTPAELTLRADKLLLRRINKYLSGVPPPPSHTISQKDCDDFLVYIKQNRQFFWADPFKLDEKTGEPEASESKTPLVSNDIACDLQQKLNQDKSEDANTSNTSNTSVNSTSRSSYQGKPGLRNLSTAFDACEQSSYLKIDNNDSLAVDAESTDTTSSFSLSDTLLNQSSVFSQSTLTPLSEDSKLNESNDKKTYTPLYSSILVDEAVKLSWPESYEHRCHELYYNRNKSIEEFENLRIKLCDRYIGAETQSTCNIWFAKQVPGSARKRSLLAKRNNGQSPGKRLSYLARRRRTFSSANLQGLGLVEKKQLMLNVKKGLIRKGKSPRGKSPRGKSPRGKTPRSSAKKRQRRLLFEGPSPRKTKIETSKRALFQSPPADRPGPSRAVITATVTSNNNNNNNNNPQRIKRALFSTTPKKNEAGESSASQLSNHLESRKRKSEEDLENPKNKWAKSLSFDCSRNLETSSSNACNFVRHSTSGNLTKDGSSNYGKCELSDTHRKKLLWAVAEALRGKGIGMSHPQFKQYAACLARTVRKYMPDLENKNVPRKPGSTSDRMLKLAKRHVLLIVDTKTAL